MTPQQAQELYLRKEWKEADRGPEVVQDRKSQFFWHFRRHGMSEQQIWERWRAEGNEIRR